MNPAPRGYTLVMDQTTDRERSADRRSELRWLLVCALIAAGAVLYAALLGQWWGDALAFVIAVGLGWIAHMQWGEALTADVRRRRGRRDR